MDEEMFARSVASICGALTVLANANDPSKPKPKDAMAEGLAYADCWLDQIMPFRLKVSSKGDVSFELDDGEWGWRRSSTAST